MDRSRTCLTGAERTVEQLARRLNSAADLQEVRLDLLDRIDAGAYSLVARHGPRVIATCRPVREGGGFDGDEAVRLAHLKRAVSAGAGWVDIELEAIERGDAASVTEGSSCKTVASVHDFAGGVGDAPALMARLGACAADVSKLAVTLSCPEDLVALKDIRPGGRMQVVIGMGALGTWTRLRPADFGSAWSYVVQDPAAVTAPGQLSLDRAMRLRLADHTDLRPVAVVGHDIDTCMAVAEACCDVAASIGEPLQFVPLPARGIEEVQLTLDALAVAGALDVQALGHDATRLHEELEYVLGRPLPADLDLARQIGWT